MRPAVRLRRRHRLNRPVDGALAEALAQQFVEVLFAPGYDEAALETLASKTEPADPRGRRAQPLHLAEPDVKQVSGGLLVQDRDLDPQDRAEMTVATERQPTDAEWRELLFAWRVCKHVRSNAIVLAEDGASVGIGAGQMSRVDSVRLAIEKAREGSLARRRAGLRRLLPFRRRARSSRSTRASRRSSSPAARCATPRSIEAADAAGIAMVFTSRRHFRH